MSASRTFKVLILSSGQVLVSLVALVSAAILTRVFTKTDFATYRQSLLACTFAFPFVVLGLDRDLYTFLLGEKVRARGLLVENLLLRLVGQLLTLDPDVAGGRQPGKNQAGYEPSPRGPALSAGRNILRSLHACP
jgi:hypothetical protein